MVGGGGDIVTTRGGLRAHHGHDRLLGRHLGQGCIHGFGGGSRAASGIHVQQQPLYFIVQEGSSGLRHHRCISRPLRKKVGDRDGQLEGWSVRYAVNYVAGDSNHAEIPARIWQG